MTSTGTHYTLRHGAGQYIMHKISAIMRSSFYQALQDQERICAQLNGMVCQHQNKTTGDGDECYPNLLFHVPVPIFLLVTHLKKIHGEERPQKNGHDQGRHSFEQNLKTFLQKTFIERDEWI